MLAEGLVAAEPLASDKVVVAVVAGARGAARRGPARLLAPVRPGEGGIGLGPERSGRADGRPEDSVSG